MGSGISCTSDDSVWKLDSLGHILHAYSLHNLTAQQVQFAVYTKKIELGPDSANVTRCSEVITIHPQERLLITKPKFRAGYSRIGVVKSERDAENTLERIIPYSRWKPEYEDMNDGDPAHVMQLEGNQ
jgi:hypothetical protein